MPGQFVVYHTENNARGVDALQHDKEHTGFFIMPAFSKAGHARSTPTVFPSYTNGKYSSAPTQAAAVP